LDISLKARVSDEVQKVAMKVAKGCLFNADGKANYQK
jgi:hypothetical protein